MSAHSLRRNCAGTRPPDRCRIVLRCADGLSSKDVASELGHSEHTVGKWRRRFAEHRIEGPCCTDQLQLRTRPTRNGLQAVRSKRPCCRDRPTADIDVVSTLQDVVDAAQ
ncbi:helix-turn-helix domain-containing protein, partial [Pseudophaeobacter arcticus]|uniref:helix-turn-helix domain-containing protein n=1 Tax=Pseudophaeobacter arcticus TaxID=385492 RepID=UPI003A96FB01